MPVVFSPEALQQLNEWKATSRKIPARILILVLHVCKTPFTGSGNPKPLNADSKNTWTRQIYREHRLVYEVREKEIYIISCRNPY